MAYKTKKVFVVDGLIITVSYPESEEKNTFRLNPKRVRRWIKCIVYLEKSHRWIHQQLLLRQ